MRMRTRRQVLALACAAFAAAVPLLTAHAQVLRNIPADAPRAKLTVTSVNAGTLDAGLISSGTDIRFAPGLRILSQEGRLLPTSSLVGQTLKVRYKLDLYQQLLTAWAVSDDEYKAAASSQ
ncbi:hypothetical protein LMG9673_03315 [Ralstonia pseudosolanacearum]|nr:hypothetical protein LMG9673_03315 [Ralstonia pseudosolanacearum]